MRRVTEDVCKFGSQSLQIVKDFTIFSAAPGIISKLKSFTRAPDFAFFHDRVEMRVLESDDELTIICLVQGVY